MGKRLDDYRLVSLPVARLLTAPSNDSIYHSDTNLKRASQQQSDPAPKDSVYYIQPALNSPCVLTSYERKSSVIHFITPLRQSGAHCRHAIAVLQMK